MTYGVRDLYAILHVESHTQTWENFHILDKLTCWGVEIHTCICISEWSQHWLR